MASTEVERHVKRMSSAPNGLGLMARAGLAMVPGASMLPVVGGTRGKEVPDVELVLESQRPDQGKVSEYARVCGFHVRDSLPVSYPHVMAFPLHMSLMTDPTFPFPAIGLVHLSNTIRVERPLGLKEELELSARPTPLRLHPRGQTFSIVTEARSKGRLVWEETSTMLRRGRGDESARSEREEFEPPRYHDEWKLPGDLGRRYGGVSGDRNPIHIHPLTARLFGFPRAIAHGMWTKARCLAALSQALPSEYEVSVSFRKPILLPARVVFASGHEEAGLRFQVRASSDAEKAHLDGLVTA